MQTKKNNEGDIVALCNNLEAWSPVIKEEAIKEIESGLHKYFVNILGKGNVFIKVVMGKSGKFLRTDPDETEINNLDYLADC